MSRVYFTVKSANELLPKIRPKMERLVKLNEYIEDLREMSLEPLEASLENELLLINVNKEYHQLSLEMFSLMENLVRMGVYVKDLEKGLVDFYSRQNGRDVFLCWRLGEKRVEHWHDLEAGEAGRQPVSALFKRQWE